MPEFSPDQTRRWDAWQSANAISERHSERRARDAGLALISVALIALAVILGR
jgi:hypothetical protein